MTGEPSLLVEKVKDVTIVTFRDATLLDTITIQQLASSLYDLVEQQGSHRVVLCFAHVKSLSSAMLGVLLTMKDKIEEADGRMVLAALSKDLRRLFEMTALHKLFQFADDNDEALAQLGVAAEG